MKKTLVTAITTALVVGAASTTFAAANPFSDVPRDNWAYDAVAKLAQDGVVNGYGDGTFRGDNTITRYEMAQIVAKAMAKDDVSAADKATIDKLAAEYADELNNLGVRVDNLEKKVDNVKFTGEARYRYTSERHVEGKTNHNGFLFRLEPTAQINENWVAKARMDWESDLAQDTNANTTTVDRVYVEGSLFNGKADVKLGKFPTYSSQGLIIDANVSGGEIIFGDKLKTTITAAKYNNQYASNPEIFAGSSNKGTGNYAAIQFDYPVNDKLALTASYNTVKADVIGGSDKARIWAVGGSYKFDNNISLAGLYAKNTEDATNLGGELKAGNVQLSYKGADAAKVGSFGAYAAYRHIGKASVLDPTYDGVDKGQKGYEIGTTYTFYKNVVGTVLYFDGTDIATDKDASKLFANVDFFF